MNSTGRFESLDVFRGVTIAAMIVVNNPGDWSVVYPTLMHAAWSGWTFADLVFPWFLFIMGAAMPFAFERRRLAAHTTAGLYRRIARRVALLIVLGLVLNAAAAWPAFSPLRVPGVLQRIALSYLIASVVVVHFPPAAWTAAASALLLGHWGLLALVPFGGYPAGTLTPDHNLARYVDAWVFGAHTVNIPIDPEGLLGTAPAAATALIGALAGRAIHRSAGNAAALGRVLAGGCVLFAVGIAWSRILLVSKPLWTGSFVCLATGLAIVALTATHIVVDLQRWRSWASPFLWLGVNPLAIYFASEVVGHALDGAWIRRGAHWTTPKSQLFWGVVEPALHFRFATAASLAWALAFTAVWVAAAGTLVRRNIRIHV